MRAALLGLLESIIGEVKDAITRQKENDEELGVHLHKVLWGRRYLIVLDDVWEKQAWHEMQRFLPDCNNRSRAMITTWEMSVANHARSNSSHHHQMQFLNKNLTLQDSKQSGEELQTVVEDCLLQSTRSVVSSLKQKAENLGSKLPKMWPPLQQRMTSNSKTYYP